MILGSKLVRSGNTGASSPPLLFVIPADDVALLRSSSPLSIARSWPSSPSSPSPALPSSNPSVDELAVKVVFPTTGSLNARSIVNSATRENTTYSNGTPPD
jgi:hypothetical protein